VRVISVLPSATEIVCALGHRLDLVGRSAECDYPPEVQRLPAVMWPRTLDAERPSAEIDRRVREVRGRDESLYTLDVDALRELSPDLLLTQDLCGVCSVTDEEVRAACARAGVAPRVVSLTPRTLPDVWATFERVAEALHDRAAGTRLVSVTRDSLPRRTYGDRTPRTAVIEWVDPPILSGLWAADIVAAAGGVSVGPVAGEPGERTSWAEIARRAPDLVVISPCSFSVPRTLREMEATAVADEAASLAPPLGTYVADEAYFSRPGPRLADGVRLIHSLLGGAAPSAPFPVVRWSRSREVAPRS